MSGQPRSDVFYGAMLRYIGCTALDYEMCAGPAANAPMSTLGMHRHVV
jgi:hypothetical protein